MKGDKPRNKYLRKIPEYASFGLWCDRCRQWTDQPERHNHGERPLD